MPAPPARASASTTVRIASQLALAGTTFTTVANAYFLQQTYVATHKQTIDKSLDQKQTYHTSRDLHGSSNAHDPFQAALLVEDQRSRSTGRTSQEDTRPTPLGNIEPGSILRYIPTRLASGNIFRMVRGEDEGAKALSNKSPEPTPARGNGDAARRIIESTLRPTKESDHNVYSKPPKTFSVDRKIDFFTMPRDVRNMTQAGILPLRPSKRDHKDSEDSSPTDKHRSVDSIDQWLKKAPSKGNAG